MSGIVGHMMYAVLGEKAARQRKLPVAPIIQRHYASYLCGSYLGCDIQTLPEAVNFRHALWQMGEAIADLFEQIVQRQPLLQDLPTNNDPTWAEISQRWKRR